MIIKNILYNSFKNKIVFFIVFIINVTILISFALVNFKIDKINISKNKIGSDLVVSSDDTKEILYNNKLTNSYIDKSIVDEISAFPEVQVTSRLYLTSLDSGCCDNKIQLIAADLDNDYLLNSFVKTKSLNKDEIILGSNFTDDEVKYFDHNLKVVERLDKTGNSYDSSGFISLELAKEIYPGLDGKVSLIFINTDNIDATQKAIGNRYDLDVFSVNDQYKDYINSVGELSSFVNILCIILLAVSLITITGFTTISMNSRKNEVGTYFIIKWNKSKILWLFIKEQLFVILSSTILAIIISFFLLNNFENTFGYIVNNQMIFIYSIILFGLNTVFSIISTIIGTKKVLNTDASILIKEAT